MAKLLKAQVVALRQRVDAASPGQTYPRSLVVDLLDTVDDLRSRKKQWQHVAQKRQHLLAQIFSVASRAVSEGGQDAQLGDD